MKTSVETIMPSVEFDRLIEGGPLKDNKFPYRVWSFYGISFGRWFKVGITVGRKGREYTAEVEELHAEEVNE